MNKVYKPGQIITINKHAYRIKRHEVDKGRRFFFNRFSICYSESSPCLNSCLISRLIQNFCSEGISSGEGTEYKEVCDFCLKYLPYDYYLAKV